MNNSKKSIYSTELSIGIFDSGLGGLSVMKDICKLLPFENIVYFGDTARMPYGTKSGGIIERYAIENATFLMQKEIKALVVACNTASCFSLTALQKIIPVPVIGVICPVVEAMVNEKNIKKIAILGTQATVSSGLYQKLLQEAIPNVEVQAIACPLLVHLVEEEYLDHPFVSLIIQEYLASLKKNHTDCIILACTHFPLLLKQIQKELPQGIRLIDPGMYCAHSLKKILEEKQLLNLSTETPTYRFYVSDGADKFQKNGKKFFQGHLSSELLSKLAVVVGPFGHY